jgi:hypothetical protein
LHRAARWTDEGFMLSSGARVAPNPTTFEKLQLGLGFNPLRLSKQYEMYNADYQVNKHATDKKGYTQAIAQAQFEGNWDEAFRLEDEAFNEGIEINHGAVKRSLSLKYNPDKAFSKASLPQRILHSQIYEGR